MLIEYYVSYILIGFAVVSFVAWWVDTKKKAYRREDEIKPLTGVVLPKKKDEDANE